jgi:hypothetical protein
MITVIDLSKVVCKEAIDKRNFELVKDQYTTFQIGEEVIKLKHPKGFIWDGATIPRVFWSILGYHPGGIMIPPSLWHDLIYKAKGQMTNELTGEPIFISRKNCDLLFKEHCIHVGVKRLQANRMYWGVRLGGAYFWRDFS